MLRGVSGTWTEPQTFEDSTIFAHSIDITGSTGLILENDETITNSTNGLISLSGNLAIPNGGTIGSASDTDSITIASAGAVTFSQGITSTAAANALAATTFSGDATFTDDSKVTLGTGGDVDLFYDGSDTYLENVGHTGGVMIGLSASPPAPDQDAVHIWKATAGSTTANSDSLLVLEHSGNVRFSMLTPDDGNSGIFFGDASSSNVGGIIYDHADDSMDFRLNGATRVSITAAGNIDLQGVGDLLQVGASGNEWTTDAITLNGGSNAQTIHCKTDSTSNSATVKISTGASATASATVAFNEGAGNGTTNNMGYAMAYRGANNWFHLQTKNDDGGSSASESDIFRVADGQVEIKTQVATDTPYDDYDDVALLETYFSPTAKAYDFGRGILKEGREALIEVGVLERFVDGWIGYSDQRMDALLAGGIYQTRAVVATLEERLAALEARGG